MSNRHRVLEVIGLTMIILLFIGIPMIFGIMIVGVAMGMNWYFLAIPFGVATIGEAVAIFLYIGQNEDIFDLRIKG